MPIMDQQETMFVKKTQNRKNGEIIQGTALSKCHNNFMLFDAAIVHVHSEQKNMSK